MSQDSLYQESLLPERMDHIKIEDSKMLNHF